MDTANCPDAVRIYREWDKEIIQEAELERLREAFIGRVISPEGYADFKRIMDDVDDDGINRDIINLMHSALIGFFGSPAHRLGHRQLIIAHADKLAQKIYRVVHDQAKKEAERKLREMREGEY